MSDRGEFAAHNEEVRNVWEAYRAGRPVRVPVGNFTIGPRIWVLDPALNREGISWERFSTDPRVMFDVLLQYKHHLHHRVVHDIEMGIPAAGWEIFVEFVNTHEPAWFGCPMCFEPGQVSAAVPAYTGDRLNALYDRGMPDPFGGIYSKVREFYEYFLARAKGFEFHGKPVAVARPGAPLGTDGPLSVSFALRGEEVLADMLADPDSFHRLMDFVTTATIQRVKAWRKYLGIEDRPARGYISDDVVQLISTEALREHVLPYHRRLLGELYGPGPHGMHLCGNVQRHLPLLVRELNIGEFDTGFPVRFETLRDEIGPDVAINGGVHVDILLRGSPDEVAAETRRILESGIMRGGRFVMKEANNVPPGVPAENFRAMYETTRRHGRYLNQRA